VLWEVCGFDLDSAEFAGRPLCVGGGAHEGIYILVHGGASSASQFLNSLCGRSSDGQDRPTLLRHT